MKSIERRFAKLQQSCPDTGSYIHFAQAVEGGQFAPVSIRRWFYRLVEKDEYSQKETRELFLHLDQLSNPLRTTKIRGTFALRGAFATHSISRAL